MTTDWLIAIDDTDNLESIGTGKLARRLADHLEQRGLLGTHSTTRHQLLVHPDIPYTSHNSSSCIRAVGDADAEVDLFDAARTFLRDHFHEGANPGLCIAPADRIPDALVDLARRAQREVLDLAAFDRAVARMNDLRVWSSGPTGQGRIGACAGVALRSTGEDGRFIGLAGIRDLDGRLCAREIVARSDVEAVQTTDGAALDDDAVVETQGWVRPGLRGGRAVLVVRSGPGAWVPNEQRSQDD